MKLGNRWILGLSRVAWKSKAVFAAIGLFPAWRGEGFLQFPGPRLDSGRALEPVWRDGGFGLGFGTALGGYPGVSLSAASMNRALSGQALDRWKRTRRLLRGITAPISSRFRRMVPAWARAISVPVRLMRRIVSSRV